MGKFQTSLLVLLLFLPACATQKFNSNVPKITQCPRPVVPPQLIKLPEAVTSPEFLQRLESRTWQKPSEPTPSE